MTKQQNLHALSEAGQALNLNGASKRDLIHLFAQGYRGKLKDSFNFGPIYRRIYNIEGMPLSQLREVSVKDTAVAPMTDALKARGVELGDTLGDLMDTVGFTQEDLHEIVCHCHGAIISGQQMADRLLALSDAQ
jgi:hypothetical protein